mgnify:CR=1 FL=1
MKIPKTRKRYCKYCKKHTQHKIAQSKTGSKRGALKRGSIDRAIKRLGIGSGNKGRWGSKPAKTKRGGAKSSKKTNTKYTCSVCKKTIIQKQGIRTKKIET